MSDILSLSTRRTFLRLFTVGSGAALIAACTPPAPPAAKEAPKEAPKAVAPTTAPAKPAEAPAKPAEAAKPAAQPPAAAAQTMQLKMQSAFSPNDIFHQMTIDYVKKIEEMSMGRVKIDVLPNNAIVPFNQIIDAVHQGLLDAGTGVPAYWFDKNRGTSLWGTGPSFGMDADMMIGWVYYGGGQDLYNELIQKVLNLNVISFFNGPMPTQPLGWFKREVKTADEFKGLKYRTVGLSADLFKEMGAAVVILPGGEIVPSLERGVIDAAEFNNPSSDKLLGFADVAKILMVQSYHQPVEYLEFLVNKQKYESFPSDIQAIFKYGAIAQSADSNWKYFMDANSKDLIEFKSKGVQVIKTPRPVLQAQLDAWNTIIERESKDPFFAKVIESQKQWARRVVPLRAEIMVESQMAYDHYFKGAS